MFGIEDAENTPSDILEEYKVYFEIDEKISQNPYFLEYYSMVDEELRSWTEERFGPAIRKLTKTQAACLSSITYEEEPFCEYLVQNVRKKTLEEICNFETEYVGAMVIQYVLATKLGEVETLKRLEGNKNYLEGSVLKFVPVAPFNEFCLAEVPNRGFDRRWGL